MCLVTSCYVLGMVALAAGASVQGDSSSIVFQGVTVIDVASGRALPDQTVVVTGNRVRAVGPMNEVKTPTGARTVDARGKYLIPGLWDMHVHPMEFGDVFRPLMIANGITGMRDAGSVVPLQQLIQERQEILAGTRIGPPRQILNGPALDDYNANSLCRLTIGTLGGHLCPATPTELRAIVDSLKNAGADMIKTYALSPDMYFALANEARRLGIPFGGHLQAVSALEASDSGMNILDHVNTSGDLDRLCLGPTASVEQCRPVAERFRSKNTWWVSTLTHRLALNARAKPSPGAAGNAVNTRFSEVMNQFWAGSPLPDHWLRGAVESAATDSLRFLSVMQRAGLPMLAGTDAAVASAEETAGFSLHTELAIYVAEGLTPLEALRTATLNPAQLLHATDSLGTVAPGKLADLVLLDANPLADITNTTTIRAVVANGRYFDRAALDEMLAEARAGATRVP